MRIDERDWDVDVPEQLGKLKVASSPVNTGKSQVRHRQTNTEKEVQFVGTSTARSKHQLAARMPKRPASLDVADGVEREQSEVLSTHRTLRRAPDTRDDPPVLGEDEIFDGQEASRSTERLPAGVPANRRMRRATQIHPRFYVGMGMLIFVACMFLWSLGISLTIQVINTWLVPPADHVAMVRIPLEGHTPSQYVAFVDTQNHLDVLALPGGDVTHAHVVQGPDLSNLPDPQHTFLTMKVVSNKEGKAAAFTVHYESTQVLDTGMWFDRPGKDLTVPLSVFGKEGK